ncbi:hypothetical protein DERP_002685 [Dermatophagoides pteronyssinus]|uniref:Cystatin domain-containing protein n=1 Tax=Dermatophagoides pteronyssinus TaxID=6956 RepID=A0ABQ8JVE7_DERPT|nr:hypothetical protein DERP_002685 [Dermatophagoides pteronyssinus]
MYSKILFWNFMAASLMIMAICFDVTFGTGEWHPIDVNNTEFRDTLKKVEKQMAKKINSTNVYRIREPKSAQSQLVAGMNYKTKLEMGETNCNKADIDQIDDIDSCPFLGIDHDLNCHAQIYRLLNDSCELTEFQCDQN